MKTYSQNRQLRRAQNRRSCFPSPSPDYGKPLGGEKSEATLARIARRKALRLRRAVRILQGA